MQNIKDTIFNILNQSDKKKYKFYFVGIGGVSMYSLAIYIKNLGHEVVGSDAKKSDNTKKLEKCGIKVNIGHKPKNVANYNFVIYSYAVEHSVEVQEAKRLNIPTLSRAELLGQILKLYKTSICVAGAHGKTTTTALIYHILSTAKNKASLHLGGFLANNNVSYNYQNGDIIVSEACEYKDAFLNFKPTIAVILNIQPEHLDYFKTFDGVKASFLKFANSASVLICAEELNLQHKSKITFNGGNFTAEDVNLNKNGTYSFKVYKNGKLYMVVTPNLIGKHNVYNALASIAVANYLNIQPDVIKTALENFGGIKRRFEILNKQKFIMHDYAHHPDEIVATLNGIKSFYKSKLLVVFQPHTYSRTKLLMDKFVKCFKLADSLVVYKTYSAREKYVKAGSAKTLANNISGATFVKNKKELASFVLSKIKEGYGVVFLGAGNIDKIASDITEFL